MILLFKAMPYKNVQLHTTIFLRAVAYKEQTGGGERHTHVVPCPMGCNTAFSN